MVPDSEDSDDQDDKSQTKTTSEKSDFERKLEQAQLVDDSDSQPFPLQQPGFSFRQPGMPPPIVRLSKDAQPLTPAELALHQHLLNRH